MRWATKEKGTMQVDPDYLDKLCLSLLQCDSEGILMIYKVEKAKKKWQQEWKWMNLLIDGIIIHFSKRLRLKIFFICPIIRILVSLRTVYSIPYIQCLQLPITKPWQLRVASLSYPYTIQPKRVSELSTLEIFLQGDQIFGLLPTFYL